MSLCRILRELVCLDLGAMGVLKTVGILEGGSVVAVLGNVVVPVAIYGVEMQVHQRSGSFEDETVVVGVVIPVAIDDVEDG